MNLEVINAASASVCSGTLTFVDANGEKQSVSFG